MKGCHNHHLKAVAIVRHGPDPVHDDLNLLLANGVMTSSVVVGRVLFATDHLCGVEELTISSCSEIESNVELDRFKFALSKTYAMQRYCQEDKG